MRKNSAWRRREVGKSYFHPLSNVFRHQSADFSSLQQRRPGSASIRGGFAKILHRIGVVICGTLACWAVVKGPLKPLVSKEKVVAVIEDVEEVSLNVFRRSTPLWDHNTSLIPFDELFPNNNIPENHHATTFAACIFKESHLTGHFPHALQVLLPCCSWWLAHPKQTPVLVAPSSLVPQQSVRWYYLLNKRVQFLHGFIASLQDSLSLQYWTPAQLQEQHSLSLAAVTSQMPSGGDPRQFKTHTLEDGPRLADLIRNNKHIPKKVCRAKPRIAILNRRVEYGRSFLNVNEIRDALGNPSVVYFEKASFLEQVRFFSKVDILVTPHGAQLSGLFFLPTCATVLEIFPEGYFFADYFSSLAELSGVAHFAAAPSTFYQLNRTLQKRDRHLRPPPNQIAEFVTVMQEEWKQCCERRAASYHQG